MSDETHRGWYIPRSLPHADFGGSLQFITYRLADSLPQQALRDIENDLKQITPLRTDLERRRRMESCLDAGHGCCILRDPRATECVIENWKHFDGDRYDLMAWVVMPNHAHVLIRVREGIALSKIVQSWKSYTGKRIKSLLYPGDVERLLDNRERERCRAGARHPQDKAFWAKDYWDRFIRDEQHFNAVIDYIHQNPVKAGLTRKPEDWPWSSLAHSSSD